MLPRPFGDFVKLAEGSRSRVHESVAQSVCQVLVNASGGNISALLQECARHNEELWHTLHNLTNVFDRKIVSSVKDVYSFCVESEGDGKGEDEERRGNRAARFVQVRAIRNICVHAGLSLAECSEFGVHMHNVTYARLHERFTSGGLINLLEIQAPGRRPATVTHPIVLSKLRDHARGDDQSVEQNRRRWKRKGENVRESFLPISQLLVSSNLQESRVKGGRKSVEGKLSSSSLRKYWPPDVVRPSVLSMMCSSCVQRSKVRQSLNIYIRTVDKEKKEDVKEEFMPHNVEGDLAVVIGSREHVRGVCEQRGVSEVSTEQVMARYEELVQLQEHFTLHRNQKRIRQSHRENMGVGEACLVFDFGEDLRYGLRRTRTEMSERLINRCTICAFFLEYRLPGKEKQIMHVLVFSLDLVHSGGHTVHYLNLCLNFGALNKVLQQISCLNVWSDNASNISNREVATFVLTEIPKRFPNLRCLSRNTHMISNGKDGADSGIRVAKRATEVLMKTEEGWLDPEKDMDRLREAVERTRQGREAVEGVGKSARVYMLFAQALKPSLFLRVLDLKTISISSCQKVVRVGMGPKTVITDNFRYDVERGRIIPQKFLKVRRNVIEPKRGGETAAMTKGITGAKTFAQRKKRRQSELKQFYLPNSPETFFSTPLPTNFSHRFVVSGDPFPEVVVQKNPVGRSPTKAVVRVRSSEVPILRKGSILPKTRSRKRKVSSKAIVNENRTKKVKGTYRVRDLNEKIEIVKNIAAKHVKDGLFMPRACDFCSEREAYLYKEVVSNGCGIGRREFAQKCGLSYRS